MRKYLLCLLIIVLLLLVSGCNINDNNEPNQEMFGNNLTSEDGIINMGQITLDDAEAFISLSSNDDSGYNRWLIFYFQMKTDTDYSQEDTLEFLEEKISSATLSTQTDDDFFTTNGLLWTSTKVSEKNYNLVLTLIPDIDKLAANEHVKIESITLTTDTGKYEYVLSNYYVETKETIGEEICYISSSPVDVQFSNGYEGNFSYGFTAADEYQITDVELEYPPIFSMLETSNASLTEEPYGNTNESSEGNKPDYNDYYGQIHLSFSSLDHPVLFRPFVKISYIDTTTGIVGEGYLVPSLPAYIHD